MRVNLGEYIVNPDPHLKLKLETILKDAKLANHDIFYLSIVDKTGLVVASTNGKYDGINISDETYFKKSMNGNTYVDFEKYNNYPTFFFSSPLIYEDEIIGVLLMNFLDEHITTKLLDLGETGEMIIAKRNENGDALFINNLRFDKESAFTRIVEKDRTEVPITQAFLKNIGIHADLIDYRGVSVLSSVEYIESVDFGLVIKQDSVEAFHPISVLHTYLITGFGIVGPVIVILIFVSANSITLPLLKLKKEMENISDENLSFSLKPTGTDEIRYVISAYNKMIQRLLESQKKSKTHLEKINELQSALDNSAIIAITDKEGTITNVNDKFCEISKYSKEELIGQNHRILKSGFHPPEFYENLWKTISGGFTWQGDIKNKAKDGSYYWGQTTIVPFLDAKGNPEEYIALRVDVTDNYSNIEKFEDSKKTIHMQLKEIMEIDRQKDEFSSMISHELKTPLVPIIGYAEMLQDSNLLGAGLKQEQLESVNDIIDNAKRLEKLISDVLEAQRLEMGKLTFSFSTFRVTEFMNEIFRTLLPITLDKEIQFTNNTDNVDLTITTDKNRLLEVFTNLVQNSVDFVDKGGTIDISAIPFGNFIQFSVSDNGSGIPLKNRNTIFQKFYQTDTSVSRKHGGTGMGLRICKGIIESLGGKIWFESEEGKGTTFYFTLPKNHSP